MVIDIDTRQCPASSLPADLETWEPGPSLAALLAGVDRARLSDHDTVRLLVARDRLVSHLHAERAADIAEVAGRSDDDQDILGEFAALEVAAALRLTRCAAQHEVAFAMSVTTRLPQVGRLLRAGVIDARRARVLVEDTAHLPVHTARRVVDAVADQAGGLTTGQLRARLRKLCIAVDAGDAAARLARATGERRVMVEANPSGTANLLLLDLAPDAAMAARDRIESLARTLPADDRTSDQRRADVALDLLAGRNTSGGGTVDITVDLQTLLGLTEEPGELGGWGPVVADIARQVADRHTDGRWQATVLDERGDPLAVAVRRRPTAYQARQVRARHRTCVFPGCRRPARRSDLDHTRRFVDGGPTQEENLAPLCRFHHRAKDQGKWRYRRRPNGDHVWTSPLGHTYVTSGRSP
jgi:hypothetical protein